MTLFQIILLLGPCGAGVIWQEVRKTGWFLNDLGYVYTSPDKLVWKRSTSTLSFSSIFTEVCVHIETDENADVPVLRKREWELKTLKESYLEHEQTDIHPF